MRPILFAAAVLAMAACDRPSAAVAQPQTPLVAAGPATALALEPQDQAQAAASVVRVDPLPDQGDHTVKLYGVAGGDPAMNGLHTYIAFFEGADTGWKVFRVADLLDYRVLSARPGRVDLEITESVQLGEAGDIGSRQRRVILAWAPPTDEGAPEGVTVTPAR